MSTSPKKYKVNLSQELEAYFRAGRTIEARNIAALNILEYVKRYALRKYFDDKGTHAVQDLHQEAFFAVTSALEKCREYQKKGFWTLLHYYIKTTVAEWMQSQTQIPYLKNKTVLKEISIIRTQEEKQGFDATSEQILEARTKYQERHPTADSDIAFLFYYYRNKTFYLDATRKTSNDGTMTYADSFQEIQEFLDLAKEYESVEDRIDNHEKRELFSLIVKSPWLKYVVTRNFVDKKKESAWIVFRERYLKTGKESESLELLASRIGVTRARAQQIDAKTITNLMIEIDSFLSLNRKDILTILKMTEKELIQYYKEKNTIEDKGKRTCGKISRRSLLSI